MAFEGEDAQRWTLTNAPTLQPAVDFITKTPNGPFIDTGMNVTFEQRGRVYLSVETIREMAQVAGLLENSNAQEKALYEAEIYNRGYKDGLDEGNKLHGLLTIAVDRLNPAFGAAVATSVEAAQNYAADAGIESGIADGDSDNVQEAPVRKRK